MSECAAQAGLVEADGMPIPWRYWAYATMVIAITLSVLDATIANVALPTIAGDFHVSPAQSVGIVSVYQATIVVLLLPLAALGDIYGYQRIYMYGLAVFTVASLTCALADSMVALTAARVLQGIGAAGIMSVNTALVRYIFPQAQLGRAIGFNAMVVAVSSTIGPSLASVVLGIASWHWLFALNVPLGVAALVIGFRSMKFARQGFHKFDLPSALLTAVAFGFLISALDGLSRGVSWPLLVAQVALGVAAAILCVRRQLHRSAPLLPVDLLRIPVFSLSVLTSTCSFAAQMLAFVALPFLLQARFGFQASLVGFLIMPWPLAVAFAAPVAGHLADRLPAAVLGVVGLSVLAVGLVLLALLPAHADIWEISWRMMVCGVGFGLSQSPNNRAIMTVGPRARSGAASGMLGLARLLGQTIGATLVALVLADFPENGAELSLWLGAGFAVLAGVMSVLRLA
jgi:MFS transporter, DHA2 family, multidrug resistance protein